MNQDELALRLTELAVDYPNDEWLGLETEDRVDRLVRIYQSFRRQLETGKPGITMVPSSESVTVTENKNPDDMEVF